MVFKAKQLSEIIKLFAERLKFRRDSQPLADIDSVENFVVTRAAFIAQHSLYGYVKTRMGTRYPEMFKDDNIIHSLNIAKMHVYAACLSDLSIFAVARALEGADVGDAVRRGFADRFFRKGLEDNEGAIAEEFSVDEAVREHRRRLALVSWPNAGNAEIFSMSPAAVIRWAPIAEHLKARDTEYVENSVRFAWINIRRHFVKRLDAAEVQSAGRLPHVGDIPSDAAAETGGD